MEKNKKGILYLHMFIGTVGLLLIGVGLLKFIETVGGLAPFYGLFGFSLTMIYLHYLEEKAGISKKIGWIRFIVVVLLLVLIYIFYFN